PVGDEPRQGIRRYGEILSEHHHDVLMMFLGISQPNRGFFYFQHRQKYLLNCGLIYRRRRKDVGV
ncbi:hypothetical protein AAGW04_18950, partial [Pectobacterium aroidearum]|uniref:hypothetical protein n=1 Tax=Pectobacterium aroidearum TaxID=1201031 RepID=UPI003157F26B